MNGVLRFFSNLSIAATVALTPLSAFAQTGVVAELTEGLWAEGRDFDPFGRRPVQLWLPEGTLIFDIKRSDRVSGARAFKYRTVRTFHGYPVNLELVPKRGNYRFKRVSTPNSDPHFRLLRSVYCPGETNPIVTSADGCNFGEPVGEGWRFELSKIDDTPLGARMRAQALPDKNTISAIGDPSTGIYSFDIYERDLDLFENNGVLFRLDREHPLTTFIFVDSYFFPCNTISTKEFKEEEIVKKFATASVEAEVGFWSWFKAKASAGGGFEDKGTSISSTRTQQDSSKASVFSQWGLMRTANGAELPFFVEKRFECQSGAGTTKPGDWITSVEVSFWNDDEDINDVYEFNAATDWVTMNNDVIKKRHQRPVFFSVNDSDKQAQLIQNILSSYPELNYNQAVFIFSQLNNGCSGRFRDDCNDAVSVVPPR